MSFVELKEKATAEWQAVSGDTCCIFIDPGSSCASAANAEVFNRLTAEIAQLKAKARVIPVGSLGWREVEPVVAIQKPGKPRIYYANVTPAVASELVQSVVTGDVLRADLALAVDSGSDFESVPAISKLPFFGSQNRVLLSGCGRIAIEDIHHTITLGAFEGLNRALAMNPELVFEQLESVLSRETIRKWRTCKAAVIKGKCVIARVSEGGELSKDVFLLEGDSHAALEGMLVAAYAVGANRAIACVDPRDAVAKRRVELALEQMGSLGLLGNNILASNFDCTIELRDIPRGLGGEEDSILVNFLEGRPARASVPFPEGRERCEQVVESVETFAKLSSVLRDVSQAPAIRDSKVITITGCVQRTGVVEVQETIELRKVVDEIAGGTSATSELKAIQLGAPVGGVVPAASLDVSLKAEDLAGAECVVGSGSLVAFDTKQCAIDIARDAVATAHHTSCGQCTFGREGTRQLTDVLTDLTRGRAKAADIELLTNISDSMKLGSLCVNGRTAPDVVLTTLQHFRSEYEAHVNGKQCPTEVCEMK